MTASRINKQKLSIMVATAMAALVVISAVYASAVPVQQAQALNFKNVINLGNGSEEAIYYDVDVSGNNVYVVRSYSIGGNRDIFFNKSTDIGASFNDQVNLSSNSGNSNHPETASSGNNVYVVWQDDTYGSKEIFFARSTDNGASFSSPINISNNSGDSELPQIAVSGANVYVVWRDNTLGNYEIFLRKSTDNGASFGDIINLSKNSGDSILGFKQIQIATSGSNVYVIWQDNTAGNYDVFFARSTDNGASFSSPINISSSSGTSVHPEIAITGSNVYAVWLDDTPSGDSQIADVFFARSTDNGASFSSPINISNNSGDASVNPKIVASGNNVYVAWTDWTGNFPHALFSRSTDNGASFDPAVNISSNSRSSGGAQIATSGSNVYVIWQDNTGGNYEIFFKASTDNGASFTEAVNLSNNSGDSAGPMLALSDSSVHTIWIDNTPGKGYLFFRAGMKASN